jgi:hypothetical protein
MPTLLKTPNTTTTSCVTEGITWVRQFITKNSLPPINVEIVSGNNWLFSPCAYYRRDTIYICVDKCARPCTDEPSRNWSFPGNTVDRTPFGVLAHELGHHVDYHNSVTARGPYYGNFSIDMRKMTQEKPLTGYCPNDAEWFAEMFRLFVTNPNLLSQLRPVTYLKLAETFRTVTNEPWRTILRLAPLRVIRACENKGAS